MDATKGSQEFTFYLVSQLLCHCQLDVDIPKLSKIAPYNKTVHL